MDLFDTHCHIQSIGQDQGEENTRQIWDKLKDSSIDQVVDNAHMSGVSHLMLVGCTYGDSLLAAQTAKRYEQCWASIGIHPHEARVHLKDKQILNDFKELINDHDEVVAIGECGLDYYYQHSPKQDQLSILEFQIKLALDNDLPLIFHVREAFDDFWPVFDSFNSTTRPIRGVLHSFTDNMANLEQALQRGLYIGVNGIATFAKDPAQIKVYESIPLSHLLLETDSPFLTPVPLRGTINEPKNVGLIAAYLAKIRGEDLDTLAKTTTLNARKLFTVN